METIYTTDESLDGLDYRMIKIGRGLIGVIRTAYIWSYARTIQEMYI